MQRTDTPKPRPHGAGVKHECCTDAPCDSGLRNQYFEGKRLTAESFRVEQTYLIERRRLLNRSIHGWGVVHGYGVKSVPVENCRSDDPSGRLEIGAGLALDACGRELLQMKPTTISAADVTFLDEKGVPLPENRPPEGSYEPRPKEGGTKYERAKHEEQKQQQQKHEAPTRDDDDRQRRGCWLLSAHYAEQLVGPQSINDPCSCERHEWDHVCETVRYSLTRIDCKACCKNPDADWTCECCTGECCAKHASKHIGEQNEQANPTRRGGCQCLCEYLTGLSDERYCGLKPVEDACAHVRADWRHGVPLACVSLREGECDDWLFGESIEACGPRRLVKGNDVLFDLIRGRDLTRISAIGWAGWHRSRKRVEWDAFEASFGAANESERQARGKNKRRRERVPVATADYWVEFSRPVVQDTVRADCFSMTVFAEEDKEGWAEMYRVPILGVQHWAPPGTPSGLVTRATIMVDLHWLNDAVRSENKIFNQDPTTIEIEIRGDLIVDCNGQTVDANASGLAPAPSGNGTPGGTFFSTFDVQPADSEYRIEDESAQRAEGA